MDTQSLRESATDAIRYWEPRRLAYNAVLTLIVLICFFMRYPASRWALSLESGFFLFILVVLANVAYCAAYVIDIFFQISGYRDQWRKYRWTVFLVGLAFAGVLTRFCTLGMLANP
jgi:hypothetical protein